MPTLDQIAALAKPQGLAVLGLCQADRASLPEGMATMALLGPDARTFWPFFTASAEYRDGAPDPMDRWSTRVIGAMAQDLSARAVFPFGATPPHPFYSWALATGRVWSSPVRFLVHAEAGLWVSFRGALGFATPIEDAPVPQNPCMDCAAPCATACPVAALAPEGYDVAACHAFLDSPDGQGCMTGGCIVRAACPVSQRWGRLPAHSEFHMRQFHR